MARDADGPASVPGDAGGVPADAGGVPAPAYGIGTDAGLYWSSVLRALSSPWGGTVLQLLDVPVFDSRFVQVAARVAADAWDGAESPLAQRRILDGFFASLLPFEGMYWSAELVQRVLVEAPWHGEWFAWHQALVQLVMARTSTEARKTSWGKKATRIVKRHLPVPFTDAFDAIDEIDEDQGLSPEEVVALREVWALTAARAVWAAWRELEAKLNALELADLVGWAQALPAGPAGPPDLPPGV